MTSAAAPEANRAGNSHVFRDIFMIEEGKKLSKKIKIEDKKEKGKKKKKRSCIRLGCRVRALHLTLD